jgi:hypothetical protein
LRENSYFLHRYLISAFPLRLKPATAAYLFEHYGSGGMIVSSSMSKKLKSSYISKKGNPIEFWISNKIIDIR